LYFSSVPDNIKPVDVAQDGANIRVTQSLGFWCFEKVENDVKLTLFNQIYFGEKGHNTFVATALSSGQKARVQTWYDNLSSYLAENPQVTDDASTIRKQY